MKSYLYLKNKKEYKKLRRYAKAIKQGSIVVFPTETVYGIGTNALDKKAVKKLYDVKQRPINKPVSLLVSDMSMIEKLAKNISEIEYKIMNAFFPGPLTIILNKKDIVPDIVTGGGDTVGIRMPQNEITLKLIKYTKVPIAAPSANISGEISQTSLKNIVKDFNGKVDAFIDGGKSKIGISSTIVKVENGIPKILRQGSITKGQIDSVLKSDS